MGNVENTLGLLNGVILGDVLGRISARATFTV
jgi:hypothetical protein